MFAPLSPKGYYRRGEALRELKVDSCLSLQSLNLYLSCWFAGSMARDSYGNCCEL